MRKAVACCQQRQTLPRRKPGQELKAEISLMAHLNIAHNSPVKKYTSFLGKAPHAGTQVEVQGIYHPTCCCGSNQEVGVTKAAYSG